LGRRPAVPWNKTMSDEERCEFSHLISIDRVESDKYTFSIEASVDERQLLAARLRVLSIEYLTAHGALFQDADSSKVELRVRLNAEIIQQCIVSLEPVVQRIDVEFTRIYDPEMRSEWNDLGGGGEEIYLDLDDDDLAEPIVGGKIDAAEIIAEQLALELDPYPRISAATFESVAMRGGQTNEKHEPANPFAALAKVREKLKNG